MTDQKAADSALIAACDEQHRPLIIEALAYLDEREASWKLDRPIDRRRYIKFLIEVCADADDRSDQ